MENHKYVGFTSCSPVLTLYIDKNTSSGRSVVFMKTRRQRLEDAPSRLTAICFVNVTALMTLCHLDEDASSFPHYALRIHRHVHADAPSS